MEISMASFATRLPASISSLLLAALMTVRVEGSSMTNIDDKVSEKLQEAGTSGVPVLIVCGDQCETVRTALEQAGISITSTKSMAVGSIGADLRAGQLDAVKTIPGIKSVEFDEEARALGSE